MAEIQTRLGATLAVPCLAENPYGFFDLGSGAFHITDVLTPRPWINVLSNQSYGLVLSQAGSGFSWADNCQIFRLNRWEQDLVRDEYGRFLYVTDLDQPDEVWSTTYQPTRKRADFDEVVHATGSTTFRRRFMGLLTEHVVFVPPDDSLEVWIVTVANETDRPRRLRLASYLEWHLGGIGDWHREFHRLFTESKILGNTLVAWKHTGLREHRRDRPEKGPCAFMSWQAGEPVRWVTDKSAWLGRCGSQDSPAGLKLVPAPSETPRNDDPVAAGIVEITLAPGEERTFTVCIGAGGNEEACTELSAKYTPHFATMSLAKTMDSWSQFLAKGEVKVDHTPTDLMVNHWLPYQAVAGRLMAKCAYYQQGGAYGYRDQLQDSLMLLEYEPSKTLHQLGLHAEAMYEDGGVRHWWHPDTDIFVESHHSDTCLWLAYGVLEYVTATGDWDALENSYRFLNRATQTFGEEGTLFAHCLRGIRRCLSLRSPRGLPLIGSGDWNDGLSHVGIDGKGESVWLAMFLYDILDRWQPNLIRLGMLDLAEEFARECEALKLAVNEHGWDGEWYIAGTRDDGESFGSRHCREGQIFLNPQTWAVISGIAPPDRVERAMQSVRERLVTPFGALLLQPAYSSVDPYIGYISRYAPGLRENGGVYSHASTWAILAFAMLGDKETARGLFRGMLPPSRSAEDAELYAAEPYVMPGNVDGPDSPYAGRAGWTWYTGSAAWMRRIVKYVL